MEKGKTIAASPKQIQELTKDAVPFITVLVNKEGRIVFLMHPGWDIATMPDKTLEEAADNFQKFLLQGRNIHVAQHVETDPTKVQ